MTFSPRTDRDEVEVLDDAADRVDLDVLGQGELLGAVDVEREERVGATVLEGHHRLVAGQDDVDRLVAVAVDDGGDLVVAADAAGGALAELGARLGGDLLGGRHHVLRTSVGVGGLGPETTNAALRIGGAAQ